MFSRRKRHANSHLPPEDPSSSCSPTTSSRTRFSLLGTFSKTSISDSLADDNVDDVKGPLGLTLLSSPPQPKIDFIFVHGLGGGSRKTWSKTPLRSHYWPQEWLARDSAFESVRIHSYGYDSDYLKSKENCLNVHHFGKSFLGALSTSPCLRDSSTNIVAIGHSMGGLVIKKAFILAKQDAAHKNLARRFAAVYFLATPHRGADSAKTLKNLLKVAYDRSYVADLERNSGAIQVINDEFRHVSIGLELWSFYETQNMKLFNSPIVDPESAVLGYPNEQQLPMNADHRSICKFETPFDNNYITLRNALASTVGNMVSSILELELKETRDRVKDLKNYLEVPGFLDDDLLNVCEARMPGTCQWISTMADYTAWRDRETGNDKTMWIKGKPATGKSVLAGYVVDHLRESGETCSYYFFRHGDRSKSRLNHCLRVLAFQMASLNAKAGDIILQMRADGIRLDHIDERTLWRILFLSGVFPVTMTRHYWVIDALDECSDPTVLFDAILPNIGKSVPLRILITSRDTAILNEGFSNIPSNQLHALTVSTADTRSDLRLVIDRKIENLRVIEPGDRSGLAEKILCKSRGSFLWTMLVVKELLRCHSKKEIDQILEDVPRGMELLYKRILVSMSKATRGKQLAKAILSWVVCAVRPMTINELNGALSLDIDDTFPNLEESIAALCGQLVVIDRFGRVQMIHETAREFLLGDGLDSEFSIEKTKAHTRMAEVCLIYLSGKEMKRPRTNRSRLPENAPTTRLDFACYAYVTYSYHLSKADPLATRLFELVEQFLKSNVLTWIEAIAQSRDLNQLIHASKHLKVYLTACAIERSPLDPRMRTLRQWITDLSRIPTKFANALTIAPSAIYSLIPPFCPTDSMIYKSGSSYRRLTVQGALGEQWDDRLLCIDFRWGQPSTLCYGEAFLAVGLITGLVALYYTTSYQEYRVLDHGEPTRFISFHNKSYLMATCGMKMVKVWDTRSGEMVRSLESPPRPLAMGFVGDTLLVASHKNYIASWDLGQDSGPGLINRPWSAKPESSSTPPRRPPCALTLSPSQGMLAVVYVGQPITLWDIKEEAFAGSCGKRLPSGKTSTDIVVSLIFNPNPDIGLLAVAYLDGDLAFLDPFSNQQLKCFRANCQALAASPNGRLLAAGGAEGMIHIYNFDTFKLLYKVKSSDSYIKQLGFDKDSLRLADIRGTQCTVWELEALLQNSLSDDSSDIKQTSTSIVETILLDTKTKITAIVSHPTTEVTICGKADGTVVLYDHETAAPIKILYSHKSSVRLLVWCERINAVLSVDASNRIFLHEIHISADHGWSADVAMLFQSHLKSEKAIVDILMGEEIGKFLVSTRESDYIFSLGSGEQEMERASPMLGTRKWLRLPQSSHQLACICSFEVRIYSWTDWSELYSFSLSLDNDTLQLKNATFYSLGHDQRIMLELLDRNDWIDTTSIAIVEVNSFIFARHDRGAVLEKQADIAVVPGQSAADNGGTDLIKTSHPVATISSQLMLFSSLIAHVIGITDLGNSVFLDRSSWVCSTDLSKGIPNVRQGEDSSDIEIFRHFFVPYEWYAGRKDIVCALVGKDIILTRGGDLTVIRGAFEHAEKINCR